MKRASNVLIVCNIFSLLIPFILNNISFVIFVTKLGNSESSASFVTQSTNHYIKLTENIIDRFGAPQSKVLRFCIHISSGEPQLFLRKICDNFPQKFVKNPWYIFNVKLYFFESTLIYNWSY